MKKELKILGICGSIRSQSYNCAALQFAQTVTPPNTILRHFDLENIPQFNQDDEQRPNEKVIALKHAVLDADAILFATPEYNYSIPGVLKNAIDWASRPYGQNVWDGKPAAIMSAAIGMLGGARAQYHLRQSFVFLNMFPLNRPEVMIPFAAEKFDDKGNLTDVHTKEKIAELLQALVQWAILLDAGENALSQKDKKQMLFGIKGGKSKKTK